MLNSKRTLPVFGGLALCGVSLFGMHAAKAGQPAPSTSSTEVAPHSVVVTDMDMSGNAASQQIASDRFARPTMDVRIGGQGPFRFLVDTGAQATVVGRDVVRQLGLPPAGRAMLVATGSRQLVDLVEVDHLSFANRELSLAGIPVLETENLGADGILGLDTLQGLRVLLDFAQQRITLVDPEVHDRESGYEIVVRARKRLGQMIIADARVNGVRTAVIIDTGADISIGNFALQRRLQNKMEETTTGTDVHGTSFAADLRIAEQVVIGNMAIDDVPIGFMQSPAFEVLGLTERPALILGMSALRALDRLAIDFASRRIMFDLPRDPHRSSTGWRQPQSR